MITGVRLTQIAGGEPIIDMPWRFQGHTNLLESTEARLDYLFTEARKIGFNYVIDTIKLKLINGKFAIDQGVNSDFWSFDSRMLRYRMNQEKNLIKLLFEIDFSNLVNEDNWVECANFIIDNIITKYTWVEIWQIGVEPDKVVNYNNNGEKIYNCDPIVYAKILKYIYDYIQNNLKSNYSDLKIGGPGIYDSLVDFYDINLRGRPKDNNWLYTATGQHVTVIDDDYDVLGFGGIFNYYDYFSFHGKQDTSGMDYNKFIDIVDELYKYMEFKIRKIIPLFSTYQGWKTHAVERSSDDRGVEIKELNLDTQGYYELREFLNCAKRGVIPFKNQLIDEVYDEHYDFDQDTSNLFYGILRWNLAYDKYKPAYNEYVFLLNNLKGYDIPLDPLDYPNVLRIKNDSIDSLALTNNSGNKTAIILWPKNKQTGEKVVLSAHYTRQYLIPMPEQGSNYFSKEQLDSDKEVIFDNGVNFIIIFEEKAESEINIKEIEDEIERKLSIAEKTLLHLIDLLPDSYNKEVSDVNYYKLLRALALELADAKIEIERLDDNLSLDTAHKGAIYNNFGVLVNLKKRLDWDYEKYRNLVKGTMKSLLKGPTKESIVDAITLFTSFNPTVAPLNVNIHEAYKAKNFVTDIGGTYDFVFVVEIEKPLNIILDEKSIYDDANYVINIVKPAHTLSIVVVSLTGEENYRNHYRNKEKIDFSHSDMLYPNEYIYETNEDDSIKLDENGKPIIKEPIPHVPKGNDAFWTGYNGVDIVNFEGVFGWRFDNNKQIKTVNRENTYIDSETGEEYINITDDTRLVNRNDLYYDQLYDKELININNAPVLGPRYMLNDFVTIDFKLKLGEDYEFKDDEYLEFGTYFDDTFLIGENVFDHYGQVKADHDFNEYYREFLGLKDIYHRHRKITKLITSDLDSKKILLPNNNLFSIKNNHYPIKVYVNGVLQPYWHYDYITSGFDSNKGCGVSFKANVIRPGDIVFIIYLNDSIAVYGESPIKEQLELKYVESITEKSDWNKDIDYFRLNISTLNNFITIENKKINGDCLIIEGYHDSYKTPTEDVFCEMYTVDENNIKTIIYDGSI